MSWKVYFKHKKTAFWQTRRWDKEIFKSQRKKTTEQKLRWTLRISIIYTICRVLGAPILMVNIFIQKVPLRISCQGQARLWPGPSNPFSPHPSEDWDTSLPLQLPGGWVRWCPWPLPGGLLHDTLRWHRAHCCTWQEDEEVREAAVCVASKSIICLDNVFKCILKQYLSTMGCFHIHVLLFKKYISYLGCINLNDCN